MTRLLIIALLAGCVAERPEPYAWSCAAVYECEGDPGPSVELSLPCAVDIDEAQERATEIAFEAALHKCGSAKWVRSFCEEQRPIYACDPAD